MNVAGTEGDLMGYLTKIAVIAAATDLWLPRAVAAPANAVAPQATGGEPVFVPLKQPTFPDRDAVNAGTAPRLTDCWSSRV
jgi:hypothetical protein